MAEVSSSRLKILWIIPPILAGIVLIVMMKGSKQVPQTATADEPVRMVRTMEITLTDFTPIAQGYGVVQPAQVWKAIAQVSGRIIDIHPRLNDGEIIEQGDMLLKIDPVDYELNLVQAETQLAELDVEASNATASLKIEQRNLALAEREYTRLNKLLAQGTISQSDADTAERNLLNTRSQVQNLENTLALLPSRRELQQAKIRQAQRDLENTVITAPFNLRISGMDIEQAQYVSTGQHLFSGDSIDRVEVIAQMAGYALKNLFSGADTIAPNLQQFTNNLSGLTGFRPTVELDIGNDTPARWDAEFVRFTDSVDSSARTLGVVVAIDDPLSKIIPGIRPPLSKGMFVDVSIAGRVQPERIVIPVSAIRDNRVYVMNDQNRLEIRPVERAYDQGNVSVIRSGLAAGERLVLTDIIPAVAGMLLQSGAIGASGD